MVVVGGVEYEMSFGNPWIPMYAYEEYMGHDEGYDLGKIRVRHIVYYGMIRNQNESFCMTLDEFLSSMSVDEAIELDKYFLGRINSIYDSESHNKKKEAVTEDNCPPAEPIGW